MKLPFFLSIPHGSLVVPDEIQDICTLTPDAIIEDSDQGAIEIYSAICDWGVGSVKAEVARAIVDLNRPVDDIGGDGVIKTHTCYGVPVYKQFPDKELISFILKRYHAPYHRKLTEAVQIPGVKLAIDCHTMAAIGPPVGPDPGKRRPLICLSNAQNACPPNWLAAFANHLQTVFNQKVAINEPFQGGYITRTHGTEMPWMQLEFSRTKELTPEQKGKGLLIALKEWTEDFNFFS